jgi:replication factor C large subunit
VISNAEGLAIEDEVLLIMSKNANGDLRSAINDLMAISMSELKIEAGSIATGGRDVEEDIFAVLKKIFGGYDMQEALTSLYGLDKTPEESIQWIHKNFSYQHNDKSFLHGLQYLSRADIFLGRARRRENFKFWRYSSSLMVCGVLSAKEMQVDKRVPRYFRSPWQREQRTGESIKSMPVNEDIAKKIADYCKVSVSYARFFIVPFLTIFFHDMQKATDITASLRLDVPQIASLISGTDNKEKAKRIYQGAFAIPAKKRSVAKVEVEEAAIKTKEIETVEVAGEEGEAEAKNQKTLADFF